MTGVPRPSRAAAALAAALLGCAAAPAAPAAPAGEQAPRAWLGLVGGGAVVAPSGAQLVVVLDAPAAADRPGHRGSPRAYRAALRDVAAAERALRRRVPGLVVRDRLARVVCALVVDAPPDGSLRLAAAPGVRLVEPVRAVVPAGIVAQALPALGAAARPLPARGAAAGRGVVVALLDGPVETAHPYLAGRAGTVGRVVPLADAAAAAHGTAMAGLVVGRGGPDGLGGVAPGARLLSIRVLRPAAGGALAGTTATLLAGLDRAADPDRDGDLADRARVVLVPAGARYAAAPSDAEALAAAALDRLGAVVVAATGDDGPTGGALGAVGPLAAAPTVLAVGATDGRAARPEVALAVGAGAPRAAVLASAVAPAAGERLIVRVLQAAAAADPFRDAAGGSTVAGLAVLVHRDGRDLRTLAVLAARAGARVLLVAGADAVPAGALGLDDAAPIPVVALPPAAAAAIAAGARSVRFGDAVARPRVAGDVAPFSDSGPAADGRVRPDLVLPGVAITTSRPGGAYGAVSGSSAAAAQAAGLVATLAGHHPRWSAARLRAALVATARPLGAAAVARSGAGVPDVGAADRLALELSPGLPAVRAGVRAPLAIANHGAQRVVVRLALAAAPAGVALDAPLSVFAIDPGAVATVRVGLRGAPGAAALVAVAVDGGPVLHVPIALAPAPASAAQRAQLSAPPRLAAGAVVGHRPVRVTLRIGASLARPGGGVDQRAARRARLVAIGRDGRYHVLWQGDRLLPGRYDVRVALPAAVGPGRALLELVVTGADGRVAVGRARIDVGA